MPRCLMVTCASLARTSGYGVRTWTALRAVRAVQGDDGPMPRLLCFESLRDWLRPAMVRRIGDVAGQHGVDARCVPIWPKKMPLSAWWNLRWCARAVRRTVRRYGVDIVHAQSHVAAGACARALRASEPAQLVFDAHGVDVEESLADGRLREGSFAHRLRRRMETDALERADWLVAASQSLADWFSDRAPVRGPVRVVPCVCSLPMPHGDPEALRETAREKLGAAGRPVVLYLGGASPWQQPEFLVACFRELIQGVPRAVFLVITNDTDVFEKLLQSAGVPAGNYRVLHLPHDGVAATAVAADAGLLIRRDTLVNRVASPTKFGEYLSLGAGVVMTEVPSDMAELVRSESLGEVVLPTASPADVAAAIRGVVGQPADELAALRQRCRAAANKHSSFASILPVYEEIYGRRRSTGETRR